MMKCPLERKRFIGRQWLFKRLLHCLEAGQKGVVIVGDAGCGKTATCCEIIWPTRADPLLKVLNDRLLAYHFCNAFEATSSSAGQFVLSLVSQLLSADKPNKATVTRYRQSVLTNAHSKRLLQNPALCEVDPEEAFRKLILEPISLAYAPGSDGQPDLSVFLMIDSIHERCNSTASSSSEFVSILDLLAAVQQDLPPWLMLLCTNRRQCKCIARKFSGFRRITLDDVQRPHITADIGSYLGHRLDNPLLSSVASSSTDMAAFTNLLALKSNGCLLYLEMIMDAVCDNFLALSQVSSVPSTLNGLYLWICDQIFQDVPFTTMRIVFGVLLASRRPLSLKHLYQSVWTSCVDLTWTTFVTAIKRVSRLLWTDETMCLLFHSSFAEWLLDVKHSTQRYTCQAVVGHGCLSMFYSFKAHKLTKSELVDFAYHLTKMQSPHVTLDYLATWMRLCASQVENLHFQHPVCDQQTTRLLQKAGATFATQEEEEDEEEECKKCSPLAPIADVHASSLSRQQRPEHAEHDSLVACVKSACVKCASWWLTVARGDPDSTDKAGNSALFLAAKCGYLEMCDLLLSFNCHVDASNADGWTALRVAALQGHVDIVQSLLHYGASVDHCTADGRTALRAAAWAGHEHLCSVLINAGALVDLDDRDKRTPLITAAFNGHVRVIELLVSAGANLDHTDRDGRTALMVSIISSLPQARRKQVVQALLKHQASTKVVDRQGRTAIHYAAMEGLTESCALLIIHGADLNAEDENSCTPMMLSACYGRTDVVRFFLAKGANVDTIDSVGRTVLSLAASQGSPEIVGSLLKAGLDEMHKDNNGWIPLHYAAYNGNLGAVALLCERHVDSVDVPDNEGKTPLMLTTEEGHIDVAKCLLDFRADPYRPSLDGRTALHLAASKGFSEFCYLLLSHSSNPNVDVFDIEGRTSVYYAALEGHVEIVEMLLSFGANPNMGEMHGRTPLHVASWLGSSSIVELLHRYGANVNATDRESRTALMIAVWRNNQDVVKVLLDLKADANVKCLEGATALSIAAQEGNEYLVSLLLRFNADLNVRDDRGRKPVDISRLSNKSNVTSLLESAQDNKLGTCTTLSGSSKKSAESKSSSGYQSLLISDESPKLLPEQSADGPALDSTSCCSNGTDGDKVHSPSFAPCLHDTADDAYEQHPAHDVHIALTSDMSTSTDEDVAMCTFRNDELNSSFSNRMVSSCFPYRECGARVSRRNLIVTNPRFRPNAPS